MNIRRRDFVPIYEQVKRHLEEEIIGGLKIPNEQLPPEPELALQYNISRKTLRQALSELTKEGFLVRRKGKGTFVADNKKRLLPGKHKFVNHSLGVLVPFIKYFFSEVIAGIEDIARRNGYTVTICCTNDDPNKEREYIDNLMTKNHITNFIITPSKYERNFGLFAELEKKGATFVIIDRFFKELGPEVDYVIPDNREGIQKAVKYLKELGHRRIAFIARTQTDDKRDYILRERLGGFESALGLYGLNTEGHQKFVKTINSFGGENRESIKDFLKETGPTAIIALSDLDMRKIVDIVAEMGLSIPKDISLIGYDDLGAAEFFNPPLTTVSVPRYEMGKEAAKILISRIKEKKTKTRQPVRKVLKPMLIVRKTARKINGN